MPAPGVAAGPLPQGPFPVILCDPPWRFETFAEDGGSKGPRQHYPCDDVHDLAEIPVEDVVADDCAIFMWATAPMLPEAFWLMNRWGFQVKTAGAWAKQSKTGQKWAFGTGYLFRSAAEFYLLGTRGSPVNRSRSIRNLIVAPVREHSRKPEQLHRDIEAMYEGPYLEMFAREPRPGWQAWGNETEKFA